MKAQSGSVLIMVLVFSTLIALIANAGMESGILQLKMVNNFKSFLNIKSQVENELMVIEEKLANDFYFKLPANVKFLQFVPDTLHFGENEGSNYYRIDINQSKEDGSNYHLISTFGIRKMLETKASFLILPNGERVEMMLDANKETSKTKILFLDYEYGHKINEFIIPSVVSELVAVDSKGSGFSDFVYFGDDEGYLWKINLQNWNCQQHKLGLPGSIIAKPIVGRHPSGNGVLIYLLTKVKLNKQQVIQVIFDNQKVIKPFYTIEEETSLGQPILRQGYLIAKDARADLNIYDAFSGKLVKKEKMNFSKEGDDSVRDESPKITIEKPIERTPLVTVKILEGVLFCRTQIEFERLGRRTWKSRYH